MRVWLVAAALATGCVSLALVDKPWVVYGQTLVLYNAAIDNPLSNAAGAIGEASLPYTGRHGYILEITSFGIGAYATAGVVGLLPWIEGSPATNARALHTVMANDNYQESTGLRYQFPAGTVIDVRNMNTENPAQVVGWQITSRLVSLETMDSNDGSSSASARE